MNVSPESKNQSQNCKSARQRPRQLLTVPASAGAGHSRLRFPFCDPLQLQLDIVHILESFVRIFGDTGFDDPVQRWRRHRLHGRDERRVPFQHRSHNAGCVFAFKRPFSRGHLIQYGTQRKDIAPLTDLFAFHLLWRHVLESSHDRALARQRLLRGQ